MKLEFSSSKDLSKAMIHLQRGQNQKCGQAHNDDHVKMIVIAHVGQYDENGNGDVDGQHRPYQRSSKCHDHFEAGLTAV